MKGIQVSRVKAVWLSNFSSAETGKQASKREAVPGGTRGSKPGSSLCSTTYGLCDLRHVMPLL